MEHLQNQVEKIIDEGSGEYRSVIVQMNAVEPMSEDLMNIAADVYNRRNLILTARDLLPASQKELKILKRNFGKKLTHRARETLNSAVASLAIQTAVTGVLPLDDRRKKGLEALEPLLKSETVKKILGAITLKQKAEVPIIQVHIPHFWTSQSVVLEIGKDDLNKLPDQVPQIQNIFLNRTLKLPPLIEVRNLPISVQEKKASSWGVDKIGALSVWGAYNARGRGVKIALLDTGVDVNHPDLRDKVTSWAEFDKDGVLVADSQPHDSAEHGTHCAGTLVGGRASGKWIGVAPEAEIAAALVLKGGEGTDAQILAGIEWAINQKVDVISMSLGGLPFDVEVPDPYTQAFLSALQAGIPVVTAIGNEGNQTTSTPGNDLFAFSVGATDYFDRPAGFSGGRTHILQESKYFDPDVLPLVYSKPEVSAPGVAIYSSVPGDEWSAFNGTSMATPHVAGAIALLLSATNIRQHVSGKERAFLIQDLLTGTVEELGESGQDHRYGFGRIDVLRAIGFAKEKGY